MYDNSCQRKSKSIPNSSSMSPHSVRIPSGNVNNVKVVTAPNNTSVETLPRKDDDIFEGVTYGRNARYYISGIGHRSTQSGMLNILKRKSVSTVCFF